MSVSPASLQLKATTSLNPSKISRGITQMPYRISRGNSHCCFKPLTFGVVSYTAVVNWKKKEKRSVLGAPNSAQVQCVTVSRLTKNPTHTGNTASLWTSALRTRERQAEGRPRKFGDKPHPSFLSWGHMIYLEQPLSVSCTH